MKKAVFVVFMLVGIFFLSEHSIQAQTAAEYDKDIALLRSDVRSAKKQLLALNLTLTDVEATKFWPIYDKYAAEQTKLYDTRVTLIKEYADNYDTLTNATAASLNQRSIALDQALANLRAKYLPMVAAVLPGKKSALFFQLDKRMSLLIDLKLASAIPVILQPQ
ncbi:MAG TPA: hypothetical protein VHQ01_10185 [Pyrinomonadaceae bacterium]|nr:hypothetical protein [Pyrinomonadaceae bacterium]